MRLDKYCELTSSVFDSIESEHESNTFSSSLVMIRENDEKNDLISSWVALLVILHILNFP